ncbi:MAG: hypothetical protein HOB47_00740 [Euryarchaeota archaeon]|nr:hypothetical protein [Euryarchaeota archaeon]
MYLTAALLLLVTLTPGYALCKVLDASADRLRKIALSPALGLLLAYGLAGLLLLSDLWTWKLMSALLLLLNVVSLAHIRHRPLEGKSLTSWQKLERAMHGEVYGNPEESISDEVVAQRWLQNQRKPWMLVLASGIIASCLTLPMLQEIPFGIDWIGFSTLTNQIATVGNLSLPGTNDGFWTYTPAFPSLAAWIQGTLNISPATAVFHLGHYSLFVLVLGIGGAMDRHGAGAHGILAMGLGAGLFAKVFDSGYPSVASQLGLVVGLLVLLRPTSTRGRHHTTGFILAFFSVLLIHPTGAIYLGALMLAHILIGLSLNETYGANIKKLLFTSLILLTIAGAIALLILAPRMLDAAVFAEYGWQGGRPMLMYNGILLILGLIAAWKLRNSIEGRLLAVWFTGLWMLTAIHLIDGLEQIPVLSLLSYVLYSMGLHAFHIPLASLVALWWSDSTCLTSLEEKRSLLTIGWDPHPHQYVASGLSLLLLFATLFGNAVLIQVSHHDELQAFTQGDLEIHDALSNLPRGSVVYTENAQWGYVYDAPQEIATTSVPTLGLIHVESSIQSAATTAVYADLPANIHALNITHAVSSPLGTIGWTFAQSSYWEPLVERQGSVLWKFVESGSASPSHFFTVDSSTCEDKCSMQVDPWHEHRFRDTLGLGNQRASIPEGHDTILSFLASDGFSGNGSACLVFEARGDLGELRLTLGTQENEALKTSALTAGWHSLCFEQQSIDSTMQLEIDWVDDESGSRWLNPLGLSGRSDVLLDSTGIRLHWLEIKQ